MKHYIDASGKAYGYKPDGIKVREMTEEEFQVFKYAQENLLPAPEELQRQYLLAVDTRMTVIAGTRGYDSVESAAKYIGNTRNEIWAAEGESLRDWAIDVYEACYAILAQVMAGEMPMPSIDGLFGMLPDMVWPDGEIVPMREGDAQA